MHPETDQQTERPMPPSTRRAAGAAGLSLVEVTVMLAILLILAAMLIPVVSDSINNARTVRARNDLSQLATAITGFQRDVGPFVFEGSRLRQPQTLSSLRIVDVLRSGGDMPEIAAGVPRGESGIFSPDPSVGTSAAALRSWISISTFDAFDSHLRVNGRGYPVSISGPGNGWNGPYVSREITGDPWGHCYLANAGFLKGTPPTPGRCRACAVFILSAGPNGAIETPFEQPITNANVFGDDLAVRIQ
ncbi:MAG: hypothetical protein AB1806_16285 [Acidobacteriota bacterium]